MMYEKLQMNDRHERKYQVVTPVNFSYPAKAAKTKRMHTIIHAAMAVMPSTLGEYVVTAWKMCLIKKNPLGYEGRLSLSLTSVENVDEHEEEGDEHGHASGHHLRPI
jgi:hypothetical protein